MSDTDVYLNVYLKWRLDFESDTDRKPTPREAWEAGRAEIERLKNELAAAKQAGRDEVMEAIYPAWHGAGVDIAGGDWNRFVSMLPTTPVTKE